MTIYKSNMQLIKMLDEHPLIMESCYEKILKILHKFPPAKNENKFIYGKLGELALIKHFNKITPCTCLDNDEINHIGSSYKTDVRFIQLLIDYSIKLQKQKAEIVLINKKNKDKHNIDGLNMIVCNITDKCLYIFTHSSKFDNYIKDNGANISYKSSIITELKKYPEYIYKFPGTKTIQNYSLYDPSSIEVDIYNYIYITFIDDKEEYKEDNKKKDKEDNNNEM